MAVLFCGTPAKLPVMFVGAALVQRQTLARRCILVLNNPGSSAGVLLP